MRMQKQFSHTDILIFASNGVSVFEMKVIFLKLYLLLGALKSSICFPIYFDRSLGSIMQITQRPYGPVSVIMIIQANGGRNIWAHPGTLEGSLLPDL